MFYNNFAKFNKKIKYKEYTPISFTEGLKDKPENKFGSCEKVYNFDYNSGALIDGCGVSKFVTCNNALAEDSENREFVHRNDRIIKQCFFKRIIRASGSYWSLFMFYDNYDQFYYYVVNSNTSTPVNVPELDTEYFTGLFTTYVNGVENIVITKMNSDTIPMWQPNVISTIKYLDNYCRYKDICYFDNRTFATTMAPDNNSVFYSEEFNPTNFRISNKDTGCISFDDDLGRCEKLIEFNGDVYIFRELGISKIVKNRDGISYSGENVYKSDGVIFKKTACVCGDKILFFSSNGLFEFNGSVVKKIALGYEKFFDVRLGWEPQASYLNGIYYLNLKMNFNDDENILGDKSLFGYFNSIIKYNVIDKTSVICRGFRIESFAPVLDEYNCSMAVVFNKVPGLGFGVLDNCGTINDEPIKKMWKSTPYDFGDANSYKFIKEMKIISKSDIAIKLYLDGRKKTISVKGKDTMQTIKINQKAKVFAYEFVAYGGDNYISDIKFVVGNYE